MHATAMPARERTGIAALFAPGHTYDWLFVAASFWLLAGLHLDGWAHAHRPGLESFFTPWHAALYSGFGAVAFVTVAAWSANGRKMPTGYGLSLVGVVLFAAGGVADMLWHELVGIEVNVEALLSPSHLVLATGMALMVSGPLRASWRNTEECATRPSLPALLSASLLLSSFTFFTQYFQPGGRPWPFVGNEPTTSLFTTNSPTPDYPVFPGGVPATEIASILGVAGILIATALFVGVALVLVRRWELPFGALTLLMGLNGVLFGLARATPWWIGVALAGGLAGDIALRFLRPRLGGWRLAAWAFTFPAALWVAYFAALIIMGGVWWSAHLWAGVIVLAGLAGVLLSQLAAPARA